MAVAGQQHPAAAGKDSTMKIRRRPRQAFYSSWREITWQALTALALIAVLVLSIFVYFRLTKHCRPLYNYRYHVCSKPVEAVLDAYNDCFMVIHRRFLPKKSPGKVAR
jgi:hypothetical protein